MKRETLWTRGSRVLFGQMYEDVAIERKAFAGRQRVFAIASAGCTAIALSAEHEVTAVDINPDQLAYAKTRAAGAAVQVGRAERALELGRTLVRVAGWTPRRMAAFVNIADCGEQLRVWKRELDGPLFRLLFDGSIAAALLGIRLLTPFDSQLPPAAFGKAMRGRLERSLARFPNVGNPYAPILFTGARTKQVRAGKQLRFEHADAAAYLEGCSPGSFDAFTLSNILDGATHSYAERLRAAVRRAASPDAVVIVRSFREPRNVEQKQAAAEDRAMIWGSMYRGPAKAF